MFKTWLAALRPTLGPVLGRLCAQMVKELLCVLRDPKSRIVLVGPPVLQLLVFSFAATLEVRNIDVAVYNRDAGRSGQELVQQIAAAPLVRRVHAAGSEAEIAMLIDRQQVLAALVIPEDFSRQRSAGRMAGAQLLLDGRKANSSQVALGYLQAITARSGATLAGQPQAEPVALRHAFNPNLNFRWFVVPSLAGILVTFITLLITALSIARERELGTFDQLLVSPCTPMEIIVAKTLPAFLIGSVLATLMVGAGIVLFGIPFTGSYLALFVCLLLFILSMVGTGLMISAACTTQQQAILGTFALAVPAVLMSGFATPVENMPEVLQWAAEALPLKHFLIILRGCFLKAMPAEELWAHAWPMACIAAITLGLATRAVRSKLQ
jgi:ABC-2 type transport system permease protein